MKQSAIKYFMKIQKMNIAKIIYIGLTVLTALIFAFSFLNIEEIELRNVLWTFFWVGGAALFAGWMAWYWQHPVTWGKYLICALLCVLLFHVGLAVGVGLYYIILGIWEQETSVFFAIDTGLMSMFGAFALSLIKAGLYTLWLCLQTALITKVIVWLLEKYRVNNETESFKNEEVTG